MIIGVLIKKNEGRNNLGNILMKLREEFRND